MVPLQSFATGVLADVIRRQPPSAERTAFAWQVAVGHGLARSSSVRLRDGVLEVRPRDDRWATEIARARPTILARMKHLLGPAAVLDVVVVRE